MVWDAVPFSAMEFAAVHGHVDCVKALLEAGDYPDGYPGAQRGKEGYTPVYMAALHNHIDCLSTLIRAGADLNRPLKLAVLCAQKACVQLLIGQGADVNFVDHLGATLLHYACCGDDTDVLRTLLENAVDLNQATADGSTPLHIAVYNRNGDKHIDILLRAGADPFIKNNHGKTAFDIAVNAGKGHMFAYQVRRLLAARKIRTQFKKSMSDPVYAMCRRRLLREFEGLSS